MSPVRVLEETSTGQSGHHKSPSVSQTNLATRLSAYKSYFGHSGGGNRSNYLKIIKLVRWWRKVSPVRVPEVTSTGQSGHHKSSSVSNDIW